MINSGSTGVFINDGTIAPGGRGSVLTTLMSDTFSQSASGRYAADLDPAGSDPNDLIVVSETADVGGVVEVSLLSLPLAPSDIFVILTTGPGGLTDSGVSLVASPALHATLTFNGDDLELAYAVDFSADGLNPNQRSEVMGLIGAGIDVVNGGEAALRMSYDAQVGETTQIHSVGLKGSARF